MGLKTTEWKEALDAVTREGHITCTAALATAKAHTMTPAEAGELLDEMEIRIEKCQLGLFGYGPGKQKRIEVPDEIPEAVAMWVRQCAEEKGETTCADIFAKAEAEGLSRAFLAGACEVMDLKIRSCQLGAF